MKASVAKFSRRKPIDETTWAELAKGISYVQGEFHDEATYEKSRPRAGKG